MIKWKDFWKSAKRVYKNKRKKSLTVKEKHNQEREQKRHIVLQRMSDFTKPVYHLLKDHDIKL